MLNQRKRIEKEEKSLNYLEEEIHGVHEIEPEEHNFPN